MPSDRISPLFNPDTRWATDTDREDAERDWWMFGQVYLWRQDDGTVRRVDPRSLVIRTGAR